MKPAGHTLQFNIDPNVFMYQYIPKSAFYRPSDQPLTRELIHHYVDVIADGGIDTLTVNAHTSQLAWYPSKNVPTCLDGYTRGDRSHFYGHIIGWHMTDEQLETYLHEMTHLMDSYLDLAEAGIDWLAETAIACRNRGVTPWISVRMNDTHGATKLPEASWMNCELYKDPANRLPRTSWSGGALDYAKDHVRDFVMDAIKDVVGNYDYDGLQLEWNREPSCLLPDASEDDMAMITDWHEEVRNLTRDHAKKIGRDYPLGIKYVGTLDQMRSIGLDLAGMAQRDIIDFVSPTNFWQTSWDIPCDDLREDFGDNVAIYGAMEIVPNFMLASLPDQETPNAGLGEESAVNYRPLPFSPEYMRGNAAAKLVLGVDGIEIYNFPCADSVSHWPWHEAEGAARYDALEKIDDLEHLRGRPKAYSQSTQQGYYIIRPFETPAAFPATIEPGASTVVRIPMCKEPADAGLELVVQLAIDQPEAPTDLALSFNDRWPLRQGVADERLVTPVAALTHHYPGRIGLNFTIPLDWIREGWNNVTVVHAGEASPHGDASKGVRIMGIDLAVRHAMT